MAARFFIRHEDKAPRTISASGVQSGPPGGDNWQLISTLPAGTLDASNHSYAIWVTLRVSNVQTFGTLPTHSSGVGTGETGYLQIVLGDDTGVRHPVHVHHIPAGYESTSEQGHLVSFLVICSTADPDLVWGSAFPGASNLQIYGRLYWFNDSPTYGKNWEVSDIEYVVADLEAIPAAERKTDVVDLSTLAGSFGGLAGGGSTQSITKEVWHPTTVGALDERWLVFQSVYYQGEASSIAPGALGRLHVPYFQLGYASDAAGTNRSFAVGNNAAAGNGFPWWSMTAGGDNTRRNMTHGALWWRTFPGARHLGLNVRNWTTEPSPLPNEVPTVRRSAFLAVRVDNLPGLIAVSNTTSPPATAYDSTALTSSEFLTIEVTPPAMSFEPMVFASAIVADPLGANASSEYRAHISTFDDLEVHAEASRALLSFNQQGAGGLVNVQQITTSSTGIGYGDPAFAYRFRWNQPGSPPPGAVSRPVSDVFMIAFHPVKNPEGGAPVIPDVGDPVPLVPDAEGPPVASLPDLSPQPDAAVGETFNTRTERHRGATGYLRSWQVWYTPRRSFSLSWGPLTATQRDAVLAQITGGSLFRVTLPRESVAIPAVAVSPPQVDQASAQTWRVAVECAEIIYTR